MPTLSPLELTDGVVLLRLPTPDDLPALMEAVYESLPELNPWMSWADEAYGEQEALAFINGCHARWQAVSGGR